ncbi:MAG: LLM class F420-dependent oxidoreductase [Candidatus Tectomicrobia bacterium]|nr:LLM class F420-dependent oxidoreductase [Candidatus Tectomicrobia bacterium]
MQFGVSLPNRGPLATPDPLEKMAQKVESLGFDSIWVTDHIVIPTKISSPYPYSSTGAFSGDPSQPYLEPLTLLTYLAACTKKVRLGTSVLILPYRPPVLTAKILASLDVLSKGRVILGAGAGWMEEEFQALGLESFHERGTYTDEHIRIFKILWTEEDPSFQGKYYRFSDIKFSPKPLQKPHIPIWIGGHTPPAIRRAARLGDGWHPIGLTPPAILEPDELAQMVTQLKSQAEKFGRDPGKITISFRSALQIGESQTTGQGRRLLSGTPDQIIEDLHRYASVGVSHFIFNVRTGSVEEMGETLEKFVSEVKAKV